MSNRLQHALECDKMSQRLVMDLRNTVEKMRAPGQVPVLQREGQRVAGDAIKVLVVRPECTNALDVGNDVGCESRRRGNASVFDKRERTAGVRGK